ncbi:MAG: phenylacetic acid degradation protein [Pseudonocardiales bacterium]|nr:phenylacetic acid degradation protein [Pseudonocardiales bacterium]
MGGTFSIDGVIPVVDPTAFVHPDATLIGDVHVGAGCYIGPGASLRGDMGRIEVGAGANVQDACVLHCFPGRATVVAPGGHVGHAAVLHGCRIEEGVLIGINAVIMDAAVVGARAFVAANSFVKSGFEVPPGMLVAGTPAQIVRPLTEAETAWKANGTKVYQELAVRSRQTMTRVEPLPRAEPERPALAVDRGRAQPLAEYRRNVAD